MPLPEIEYHAEEVTVESVEYGREHDQTEKLRGLAGGIEELRGPLERLCTELGVQG
jgi:hypothetical protein